MGSTSGSTSSNSSVRSSNSTEAKGGRGGTSHGRKQEGMAATAPLACRRQGVPLTTAAPGRPPPPPFTQSQTYEDITYVPKGRFVHS